MKYGHIGDGNLHVALFIDVLDDGEWARLAGEATLSTGRRSASGGRSAPNTGSEPPVGVHGRAGRLRRSLGDEGDKGCVGPARNHEPRKARPRGRPLPRGRGMRVMKREVEDSRRGTKMKTETEIETAGISTNPRDLEVCIRCGTCRSVCTAFEVLRWKSRNTRGRVIVVKPLGEGLASDASVLDSFNTCTTSGICAASCPAGANPPRSSKWRGRGLSPRGS